MYQAVASCYFPVLAQHGVDTIFVDTGTGSDAFRWLVEHSNSGAVSGNDFTLAYISHEPPTVAST